MTRRVLLALLVTASAIVTVNASAASSLHVTATAQFAPWSLGPMRFDAANDAVWTLEQDASGTWNLLKLDPSTLAVVATTPVAEQGQAFYDLGVGLGRVWVVNFPNDYDDRSLVGSVSEYDTNGTYVRTISTYGHGPEGIGFLNGKIWVANHHQDAPGTGGSVVEIDPDTGALLARVSVGAPIFCCGPQHLTVADGSVWTGVPNLNGVVRIDPTTLAATLIPGGSGGGQFPQGACGAFAFDGSTHRLWVTDGFCRPASILRLDAQSGTLTASINPGGVAAGLAFGNESLWVSVADNGRGKSGFVAKLDPTTGDVVAKLAVGGWGDVATGDDSVYVESLPAGQILRVAG
jgi:DNA-binding beta-propeller fold protein YncE